jgi:hypothetical protein
MRGRGRLRSDSGGSAADCPRDAREDDRLSCVLLAGGLAVTGIAAPHSRPRDLLIVAAADAVLAAAGWWLPWHHLPQLATLALALAGLAVLA